MRIAAIFLSEDRRLRAGWRALLFFPVFRVLQIASVTLATPLLGSTGPEQQGYLGLSFRVYSLCAALSAGVAAYLLLRLLDHRSFRTLGLWFYEGWARELAGGMLGGFLLLSVVVGLLALAGQVHFRAGPLDAVGVLRGFGWTLLLFVPAAAAEELVFRGYPFQRLLESWGTRWAVFVPSVLFGLVHLDNPSATPLSAANTVLAGILLALCYLKTRGLWFPIAVHFSWNLTMGFIYSLPVSGFVMSSKLFSVTTGATVWLSGGNYGPEGSVLTTVVVLAATLWLDRTRRLGVSPALAKELE